MLSRAVVAGLVVAGCVLVGSPASASVSAQYSCSGFTQSRYGVTIKCDYPRWELRINCTRIGPVGGADIVVTDEEYGSNVAATFCPSYYYYDMSRPSMKVTRIW
ncbi:hypothetical protein [Allokutzneria sp. NRRL B-24872]|uniref:hypothetical protein n=1 Tax=Allokutzneria sp. NRRL B-24872 TaxID=1137961 RepID=UPI001177E2E0|nr:hypothetical protein [Allokutzneria sp. NRRL B-24872]